MELVNLFLPPKKKSTMLPASHQSPQINYNPSNYRMWRADNKPNVLECKLHSFLQLDSPKNEQISSKIIREPPTLKSPRFRPHDAQKH